MLETIQNKMACPDQNKMVWTILNKKGLANPKQNCPDYQNQIDPDNSKQNGLDHKKNDLDSQ